MNLQLSDGTTLQIPDDATPEAIRNFAARGEAHIKANPRAAAAPAAPDPYSARNTVGRIATDAVLGIPDLAIGLSNLISRPGNWVAEKITGEAPPPDLPTLAPMARERLGVSELPEDASWGRRILESGASALPTGGAGVVRAGAAGGARAGATAFGRNIAAPTVTGDVGAQVGGAIAGPDGALIGGLLGGAAPGARAAGANWVQGRYTGQGKPDAPAIAAAAERLGIEPTAGALGNYDIQKRENRYAANDPSGITAREQARIRGALTGTGEDIATQRGATGGSVAAVGDDIRTATTDRLAADREYSSAQQENLQRTVGDRAPVRVIDIINEARQAYPHLSVPGRQALEFRINNQLMPLISQRDARGNPIIGPNTTVPYELVKQFRTELGRSYEQGRYPRARELYEPTTEAMAETAQAAGVPRGDFNQVQQFTRGVEGEGGLAERLGPYDKDPDAAYKYTLEGGLKNPERVETFAAETAGDPRQARAFGNYLQQKLADPVVGATAQGANTIAKFVENADPRALSAIAGPQLSRVQDLGTLARGVDVPTGQRGLGTSVGGVAGDLGKRFLGAEMLGQAASAVDPMLGAPARGLGYIAQPALTWINQRIMQSDAAKRGMTGAPMRNRPMSMQDLVHLLNVISQSQPSTAEQ